MNLSLDPGDEVVSMVRIGEQLLVVTKRGHFFEVWYDGMGRYRINHI